MGLAADFVLIVVGGLAGAILARMLRLPLLVGYIFAGIVVGPYTAGPTVAQVHDIEMLAEIGVALLLFSLGLEVSFRDLHVVRRIALIGGPLQVLLTMALAALAAGHLLGFSQSESLWFGAMISISSTMVVLKVIAAANATSTLASKVMIGLLLVQDLAVVPMLVVLPQLGNSDHLLKRVVSSLGLAAVFLVVVFFAGTRLLPPVFRYLLSWGSRELFLVAVVATGFGVGAAMHAAGFSFALGAFLAGLMLSESEFSHQALSDVVPLRDIFGLLFFVTVGMLFDPHYVIHHAALILLVVAAIVAGKAVIFGALALAFGYRYMAPWVIGLGLSQVGEFAFVLARTGFNAKLLSKPVYDLALSATVLTIALSPLISAAALPLGRAWKRRMKPVAVPAYVAMPTPELTGHVVIAGYGRIGRAVARALRRAGVPCFLVESSYSLMGDFQSAGFAGIWGDISGDEILLAARIPHARVLLLTMPDKHTVDLAADRSRRLNPALRLVVRTTQLEYLQDLQSRGISAVQPEFEGGLEMVRQVLTHCGHADDEIMRLVNQSRREIYEEQLD
ncbi:MAG: cation:proton antiporter [Bryobacteraceae bacterium]|nr:cation:proton antiporter [Bryobacteraceae bacterium]